MKTLRALSVFALLLPVLFLISCSSDDPTDPGGGGDGDGDTTAPVVTQTEPIQGGSGVDLNDDVTIVFSEPMTAGTATSLVTMSHGTVTSLVWEDTQTLTVEHSNWPEGQEVSVTATPGLQDVAGNALAAPVTWSFTTYTNANVLLSSSPADGDTNVPFNTTVALNFSKEMRAHTLPGAITVSSPDKASHAFNIDGADHDWVLTFDADLPASTEITVDISTDAQSSSGNPLDEAASFSFTTGAIADETPPEVLSLFPADGATISVSSSYVRVTFDEPIDPDSMGDPSLMSGQFAFAQEDPENGPIWTENFTVMTIGLRAPLIPGSVFRVVFDSFADVYGNTNTAGIDWQVTVAGDAEYLPVVDDLTYIVAGAWTHEIPIKANGIVEAIRKVELKTGGEFWLWEFAHYMEYRDQPSVSFTDYDRYEVTSSAVLWTGFHEESAEGTEINDVTFTPGVTWLPLPVTTGTWSGSSTFTDDGDDLTVDFSGEVLAGTVDLPVLNHDDKSETMIWLDCRRVVVDYEVSAGEMVVNVGQDSLWYAPGVGVVKEVSVSNEEGEIHDELIVLEWFGLFEDAPLNDDN